MNHATQTRAAQSTNAAPTVPALPRRPRAGAAIASVVVTVALFGSVVLGMTSMSEGAGQIVALGHAAARA